MKTLRHFVFLFSSYYCIIEITICTGSGTVNQIFKLMGLFVVLLVALSTSAEGLQQSSQGGLWGILHLSWVVLKG